MQTDNDADMHKRHIDAMQDIANYKRRVILILQDILQQYDITINNSNDKLLQEESFNSTILDLKSAISNAQKEKENEMHADKRRMQISQDMLISNHVTASAHAVWRNIAR